MQYNRPKIMACFADVAWQTIFTISVFRLVQGNNDKDRHYYDLSTDISGEIKINGDKLMLYCKPNPDGFLADHDGDAKVGVDFFFMQGVFISTTGVLFNRIDDYCLQIGFGNDLKVALADAMLEVAEHKLMATPQRRIKQPDS